jgi:Nickel responsive protein SCO4226-like
VPSYLIERYVPSSRRAEVDDAISRLARNRGGVRHLRATFVPGDETCFHIVEAPSLEAVRTALKRAALTYERIVEAVEGSHGPPTSARPAAAKQKGGN